MKRLIFILIFIFTSFSLPSVASEDDGVTSSSVSFGASFPATGIASPGIGSYYSGIEAYFSHVNDNGGIYGRKINLIRKDDGNLPARALSSNMELVRGNGAFAFLSTAPSCSTQLAVASGINPGKMGIPNLFVDCFIDRTSEDTEESSSEKSSTTSYGKVSNQNQITILKSYLDKALPSQKIALIYQDDEHSVGISKIKADSKVHCSKSFLVGTESIALNSIVEICKSNGGLKDGDAVIYAGSPRGLGALILLFEKAQLNLKYFAVEGALNKVLFSSMGLSSNSSIEIYTISNNALISETSIEAVATFLSIGRKYLGSSTLDQRFLNGMNVGYIVSNLLGAIGPDLTRERFINALNLYGAQFDALGLSERSQDPVTRFMPLGGVVVKNVGSSSEIVSEVYAVVNGSVSLKPRRQINLSPKGLPILVQKLPNSAPAAKPTQTAAPQPSKTISPTPSSSPVLELDGEEEPAFGKISVKKEKNKFMISISSNLPNENLQVRATKRGQKSISFKISTDDDGLAKFTTSRPLAGFQIALSLDGEILSSVKAN
jgi:hypothetical protein